MKKGFFSHQLCYRNMLLNKHVIYMSLDNHFDSVFPFQREISLTTFCEGILFVVDSNKFAQREGEFVQELKFQMENNQELTIGNAILGNTVYQESYPSEGSICSLYSIPTDWFTYRTEEGDYSIMRIV